MTLGALRHGGLDPTMRVARGEVWRAVRTPEGPATARVTQTAACEASVQAWGAGAGWVVEHAAALVGADDDRTGFEPRHGVLRDLDRRHAGLRLTRTATVTDQLVPTILEQKVVGRDAADSYRRLVRRLAERAPGPTPDPARPLLLPPDPSRLAALPSYEFTRFGVEQKRSTTVRRACAAATRMEEAASMPPAAAMARLEAIAGIGPWTSATVVHRSHGDPDAVVVGDFHLPNIVGWALAGRVRTDDDVMLELLEPYRGQRARVQRLLELGPRPPKFGPRLARADLSTW